MPVVIARDLSHRSGPVLGAYTAALNVGSMLTLSLTVPLANVTGWRVALASWGALVFVALAAWLYAFRSRPADDPQAVGADVADADDAAQRQPHLVAQTRGVVVDGRLQRSGLRLLR